MLVNLPLALQSKKLTVFIENAENVVVDTLENKGLS